MSDNPPSPFLVAAVQATPVFLDRAATVEKACALIAEAGRGGRQARGLPRGVHPHLPALGVVHPALQDPGAAGALRRAAGERRDVPSPEIDRLCRAAAAAGVNVVMGVNERNAEASGTTLYNALLFIGADGRLLGTHRKLVPTVAERLVHGQGDGSTLRSTTSPSAGSPG